MNKASCPPSFACPWVRCVACFVLLPSFPGVLVASIVGSSTASDPRLLLLAALVSLTALKRICPAERRSDWFEILCDILAKKLGIR